MKYLNENFLHDQQMYALNEAFYEALLKEIIGSEPLPFFQTTYGNGEKMYSDHIFSTKYKDRILQIIQREPVSEQSMLRARVQKWDDQYEMLVLSLELSEEAKPLLEKVVKAWLIEGASGEEIRYMLPRVAIETEKKSR